MRRCFFCLLLCGLWIVGFGQDTGNHAGRSSAKETFNHFRDSIQRLDLNPDTLLLQARRLSDAQFQTALALEKQKQQDLEDETFAMRHRWRSYTFQYTASIVIFILVILIVIIGLIFSGWQFSFTLRQIKLREALLEASKNQQTAAPTDPDLSGLKSELEVSTTGIKLNSSILGVIILGLSIAFFYLYILYVYPIKYVTGAAPSTGKDTIQIKEK